jgi:hypothetical protein
MIIVKIMYGLGNQLFQYAVGRNLALNLNCDLKFDISHYFENDNYRKYELSCFRQPALIKTDLQEHIHDEFDFHQQPFFRFDETIGKITDNTYLVGFWQSERYFMEHREVLATDLKIKDEFVLNIEAKALEMQKENSVAVHVRRGDYLRYTGSFGLLPPGYYEKALKYLENRIGRFKVYLFSDDIDWVRENIRIKEEHEFISGYVSGTNIEDFYLMTNCKHLIIANSSFSWWAAWLNENKEKIVVAPKRWFVSKQYNPDDIVPENWIRM